MALKSYNPTSPGIRSMVRPSFEELTTDKPQKSLVARLKKKAGRNSRGVVTVRHRGGGSRRKLRLIDFKRDKVNVVGKIAEIEYDPNRSARIALVHYADGDKRYILAPLGLNVNDTVEISDKAEVKVGNTLPLSAIPSGTLIHCLELEPGKGAQLVRSAGAGAQLIDKEDKYAMVRLPSGEVRRFMINCLATVGQIGNVEHRSVVSGKAGRTRWLGRRPEVRGSAMTPRDHPHGGGEGRAPRGMPPKTRWGKPALGVKTRLPKKASNKMIVKRRKANV